MYVLAKRFIIILQKNSCYKDQNKNYHIFE